MPLASAVVAIIVAMPEFCFEKNTFLLLERGWHALYIFILFLLLYFYVAWEMLQNSSSLLQQQKSSRELPDKK